MCRGRTARERLCLGDRSDTWELDRIIRGCMAAEKDGRYQNAGKVEQALCELKTVLSEKTCNRISDHRICRGQAWDRNDPCSLWHINFLDPKRVSSIVSGRIRYGCCPAVHEKYKSKTGRRRRIPHRIPYPSILWQNSKNAISLFSIIIKDIGTAWQGQETLPEADFFVLVCGGKWWGDCPHTGCIQILFKPRKVYPPV